MHILAPAVVACDIFSIRRSAHPAGGFLYNRKCNFLLYKKNPQINSVDSSDSEGNRTPDSSVRG